MMKTLVIAAVLILCACGRESIYDVKKFKYFSDDEVHVDVVISSGQVDTFLCAFPPNTDYEGMKKVKIGKVKSENLLQGALHYCQAIK